MHELDSDVEAITRAIWDSLFDLRLESGEAALPDPDATVSSWVQIDGAWSGAMLLQCPMELALKLTQAMFRVDEQPAMSDVRDAFGELANMACGNVKALLPGPSTVTLPSVAVGPEFESVVTGAAPLARASFTCEGQPFLVSLLERTAVGGEIPR